MQLTTAEDNLIKKSVWLGEQIIDRIMELDGFNNPLSNDVCLMSLGYILAHFQHPPHKLVKVLLPTITEFQRERQNLIKSFKLN